MGFWGSFLEGEYHPSGPDRLSVDDRVAEWKTLLEVPLGGVSNSLYLDNKLANVVDYMKTKCSFWDEVDDDSSDHIEGDYPLPRPVRR